MSNAPTTHDVITGAQNVIDYAHHEIHQGGLFQAGIANNNLGIGANINVGFKTPNISNKWLHSIGFATVSGEATVEILEAPTVTAGTGTDTPALNKNRNYPDNSDLLSLDTVPLISNYSYNNTVTADGTRLVLNYLGQGNNRQAGETRVDLEWVLKVNTIYIVRLTSQSASNITNIVVQYYEHTNRII